MEVTAFSYTRAANASSPYNIWARSVVTSSPLRSSSVDRLPMSNATLEYFSGYGTSLASYGKCQPYHSFTRMPSRLTPLSMWSASAEAWIIMLSLRWTLNLTLLREKAWPSPHWARGISPVWCYGSNFYACRRIHRQSSLTFSLHTTGNCSASWIALPSLASCTPSYHLASLSSAPPPPLLREARLANVVDKKLFKKGLTIPYDRQMASYNAFYGDSNGAKEMSDSHGANVAKFCKSFCNSMSPLPIYSLVRTLNKAYPVGDSYNVYSVFDMLVVYNFLSMEMYNQVCVCVCVFMDEHNNTNILILLNIKNIFISNQQ